mmetsp:Transcript_11960/g.18352  ORF Transcript_11960/g.18352 Transcript_11960/m.18352 type:complete len:131 (+) Transcript_11960:168-560(+)
MSSVGNYLRYLLIIGLAVRLALLFGLHNGMWAVLYFILTLGFAYTASTNNFQKIKDLPLGLLIIIQFLPSNEIRLVVVQVSCLIMALVCGYSAIQAMNAMQIVEHQRLAEEEKKAQAERDAYEKEQQNAT